ncbi:hypothetical protein JCM19992_29900 [Thermostilla marina]
MALRISRRAVLRFGIGIAVIAIVACVRPVAAPANDAFLRGNERIIFFGDSITQAGHYVVYVDAFLATRFPDARFDVINHGISSETISGTSEPDHEPRRPDAKRRFDRDIADWNPDVVVACFGMNDGNYFPFDEERFALYQKGVAWLAKKTADCGARLVLVTPPPYDPYRRRVGNPEAVTYGYKFPAVDYDETLTRYSEWLLQFAAERNLTAADVHTALTRHLEIRRRERVSFYLSPDAVHPNPTGHWLMAQTILEAWKVPGVVSTAEVDAAAKATPSENVSNLECRNRTVAFTWTTPLPMPKDPRWDAESLAVERFAERFNRQTLTVRGLPAGTYTLVADDTPCGTFDAAQLAAGINVSEIEAFPTTKKAADVLGLLQQKHARVYQAWRKSFTDPFNGRPGDGGVELKAALKEAAEIDSQVHALCRPQAVAIRIEPN